MEGASVIVTNRIVPTSPPTDWSGDHPTTEANPAFVGHHRLPRRDDSLRLREASPTVAD